MRIQGAQVAVKTTTRLGGWAASIPRGRQKSVRGVRRIGCHWLSCWFGHAGRPQAQSSCSAKAKVASTSAIVGKWPGSLASHASRQALYWSTAMSTTDVRSDGALPDKNRPVSRQPGLRGRHRAHLCRPGVRAAARHRQAQRARAALEGRSTRLEHAPLWPASRGTAGRSCRGATPPVLGDAA